MIKNLGFKKERLLGRLCFDEFGNFADDVPSMLRTNWKRKRLF
jgi:hypothetical protein